MKIDHTIFRDTNGNKRAKLTIEHVGAVYAAYCSGARITGNDALQFDAVIARLKSRFGYRIQRKAVTPSMTCIFDGYNELKAEIMDSIVYAVTSGRVQYSRERYMNAARRCGHQEYYAQFITDAVMDDVNREMPNLLRSVRPSFNDHSIYTKISWLPQLSGELCRRAEATTYQDFKLSGVTKSNAPCVYKAAARIAVAQHLQQYDTAFKLTEIRDGFTLHETSNGFHFQHDGAPCSPATVYNNFDGRVPSMYGDIYGLLSYDMLLDTNKDLLRKSIAVWFSKRHGQGA